MKFVYLALAASTLVFSPLAQAKFPDGVFSVRSSQGTMKLEVREQSAPLYGRYVTLQGPGKRKCVGWSSETAESKLILYVSCNLKADLYANTSFEIEYKRQPYSEPFASDEALQEGILVTVADTETGLINPYKAKLKRVAE